MEAVARSLDGQLTATVHGTPDDFQAFAGVVALLETKVGRLIFNGFPTGVEVNPVCWQDAPSALLPTAPRDDNLDKIWRLLDSRWTQEPIQ